MSSSLVILGATGDLTARFLLPALAELRHSGLLPNGALIGVSHDDWDTSRFRVYLTNRLKELNPAIPEAELANIVHTLEYRKADVTDAEQLRQVFDGLDSAAIIYLALPPTVYGATLTALAQLPLPSDSRIVIEKPFGQDLASAQALNALICPSFPEKTVFRMDHFLGLPAVQLLIGLRCANGLFEKVWNRDHIRRVEIIWEETVALEGRASYYDRTGALSDMIQNHLLQVLCVLAMEPPASSSNTEFRDRKVSLLRQVRHLSFEEVRRWTIRGRYSSGRIGDRAIPSYIEEIGVNPQRQTETFAQVTLFVDNERWHGVPFLLRTGKALARDCFEVRVYFHSASCRSMAESAAAEDVLRLQLHPPHLDLRLHLSGLQDPPHLEPVSLVLEAHSPKLSAYAKLLRDVLHGNSHFFIRGDEAEESWRIIDPIRIAWAENVVPLLEYPAGSAGLFLSPETWVKLR